MLGRSYIFDMDEVKKHENKERQPYVLGLNQN